MAFQLPSTARYMACARVAIRVQSIRWPATGFGSTETPNLDGSYPPDPACRSKGTCLQADAVLWVRPMCTSDARIIDLDCVESFKQSSCFPACMGLHIRGSGTQTIILHSFVEWDAGVVLLDRHCGWGVQDTDTANATGSNTFTSGQNLAMLPNSKYGLNLKTNANSSCAFHPGAMSMIPKNLLPEYKAFPSIDLSCYATNENTCQPFMMAGDIALTVLPAIGGTGWTMEIKRIYGNANNEFTIVPLPQHIPTSGPCSTPSNCGTDFEATCQGPSGCLPSIPYRYLLTRPRTAR